MATLVTHNEGFHSDDVFAVAALNLLLKGDLTVIRTRDPILIERADYVVDVGMTHDASKNRFDHHQKGGAGMRENNIPYAAFGLVWKRYGADIAGSDSIAALIDAKLVQPIDAGDNGIDIFSPRIPGVFPYVIRAVIGTYLPTWKEETDIDKAFTEAVTFAERVLVREITRARDDEEAREEVEKAYEASSDKRLLILDKPYPYGEAVDNYPECLYVISPRNSAEGWKVTAVKVSSHSFERKRPFPESWAGKEAVELQEETGVSDAVFCHRDRFVAYAKSRDGVVRLAELALRDRGE